jgi:hypothetical protein
MPASGGFAMDTMFAKVAGLDVHQKFITVGVRCRLDTGKKSVSDLLYRRLGER